MKIYPVQLEKSHHRAEANTFDGLRWSYFVGRRGAWWFWTKERATLWGPVLRFWTLCHRNTLGTQGDDGRSPWFLVQMVIECRLPMFYDHVMSICHAMSCAWSTKCHIALGWELRSRWLKLMCWHLRTRYCEHVYIMFCQVMRPSLFNIQHRHATTVQQQQVGQTKSHNIDPWTSIFIGSHRLITQWWGHWPILCLRRHLFGSNFHVQRLGTVDALDESLRERGASRALMQWVFKKMSYSINRLLSCKILQNDMNVFSVSGNGYWMKLK